MPITPAPTTSPAPVFSDLVPTLIDAGQGITLRAHVEDDLSALIEQSVDETTIVHTSVPTPDGGYGLEDARSFLELIAHRWNDDHGWSWAIEAERDGRLQYCGTIDLTPNPGPDGARPWRASVGYALHPGARGRSVMANALRLVLDYAFADRGLSVVTWEAHVGNWASRRVAAAAGFRFEGISRWGVRERGRHLDAWRGSITSSDPRTSNRWASQPTLDSGAGRLRPLAETDIARLIEACNDPLIRRWLPKLPQPYGLVQALLFIEFTRETEALGTEYTWAITDAEDRLLGCICAMRDPRLPHTEIGYWAHPDSRGRGVVAGAVDAVTAWVGTQARVPVIRCEEANLASRAVAERSGYREVGLIGSHVTYAGG